MKDSTVHNLVKIIRTLKEKDSWIREISRRTKINTYTVSRLLNDDLNKFINQEEPFKDSGFPIKFKTISLKEEYRKTPEIVFLKEIERVRNTKRRIRHKEAIK